MRYLKLYLLFQQVYFKRLFEYRTDFFLGFFANLGRYGLGLLLVWVIFQRIQVFHGWSYHEVLAIYGFSLISSSLTSIFTPRLFRLGQDYILQGQMDRILLRPLNPLFQIISDSIGDEALGGLVAGGMALAVSISYLFPSFNLVSAVWMAILVRAVWMVIAVICGALVYFGIILLSVVVCFWFELPWGILETTQSLGHLSQYPLDIYSVGIRFALTWIIPFGFTAFLPAATLLRPTEFSIYFWIIPVYSIGFVAAAYQIWKMGVNHYVGTGH